MRKRLRLTQRQRRIVGLVEALGWASGPLLAFLDGMDPGERDYYLEEYLPRLVQHGVLYAKRCGRQQVYRLAAYGTGRNPNIEHALVAGWVTGYITRSCGVASDGIVARGAFVEAGLAQVPDGGVVVPAANGRHLFLVEYQSARESERTTAEKINGYKLIGERIRQHFGVEGVWVIFVLDVVQQRAAEIARRHQDGWPAFFFCDRETIMTGAWQGVARSPIFFWSGAPGRHALLDGGEHADEPRAREDNR